jgi:hypothetical protein
MYYDTIEEAIKAAPNCTHVLTTGPRWDYDPDIKGMFHPVVRMGSNGRFLCATDLSAHDGSIISSRDWQVAREHQPQPATTDQLITAARFDTAAGRIPAHEFLEKGVGHMKDRASQRDAEDGERSMKRCVEAFNAACRATLPQTITKTWPLMQV